MMTHATRLGTHKNLADIGYHLEWLKGRMPFQFNVIQALRCAQVLR